MIAAFRDHFSEQSGDYRQFRPFYPGELFAYLAGEVGEKERAWDCATGNGQAATALAEYFDSVIATDASAEQIGLALEHPRVQYRVARAERSGIPAGSIDLVTVANAVHWFDIPEFFNETRRVLRPGGLVAIWCYESFHLDEPVIERTFDGIYDRISSYWQPNLVHVRSRYRDIEFPFDEIIPPSFDMSLQWNLAECLGFISTWSAVQSYKAARGADPVYCDLKELQSAWGDPDEKRRVFWDLSLRVGRC